MLKDIHDKSWLIDKTIFAISATLVLWTLNRKVPE
jgi:hypothetical protein